MATKHRKRVDALTLPAVDDLVRRIDLAYHKIAASVTLREYIAVHTESWSAALVTKLEALEVAHQLPAMIDDLCRLEPDYDRRNARADLVRKAYRAKPPATEEDRYLAGEYLPVHVAFRALPYELQLWVREVPYGSAEGWQRLLEATEGDHGSTQSG
jgi:hypothetical protein